MPKFLNQNEIYRILQRELPDNVYPDGSPEKFYSTADNYSAAAAFSWGYSTLERIYANYFPQSAEEKLTDWEELVFNRQLDAGLTVQERRDRVIAKIRQRKRTTPEDIRQTVISVIGERDIEIVEWGCGGGGWILDVSVLDISTILNGSNRLRPTGAAIPCPPNAAEMGITEEELEWQQEEAYTYEVRVYSYTLTAQERIDLDAELDAAEPARSRHIIVDGLDPADKISGST